MRAIGVVGEGTNALVGYLAMVWALHLSWFRGACV